MMEIIPDVNAARRIRADVVFVDAICSNSGVFNHHLGYGVWQGLAKPLKVWQGLARFCKVWQSFDKFFRPVRLGFDMFASETDISLWP